MSARLGPEHPGPAVRWSLQAGPPTHLWTESSLGNILCARMRPRKENQNLIGNNVSISRETGRTFLPAALLGQVQQTLQSLREPKKTTMSRSRQRMLWL